MGAKEDPKKKETGGSASSSYATELVAGDSDSSRGSGGGLRSGKDPKNPSAELALQIKITEVSKALKGKKSHRQRNLSNLEGIAKGMDPADANPYVVAEAQEYLRQVRRYVADVTDLLYDWIDLEPEKEEELLGEVAANNTVAQDSTQMALDFLSRVPVPEGALATGAAPQTPARPDLGQGQRQIKPNSALKPDDLTLDHSPAELDHWQQRFRAYFRTSNMDLLSNHDQREYLNASLDHTVQGLLDARVVPGAAILAGPGSCFETLKTLWLERYPLFQRRHQFFTIDFKGALTDLPQFMSKLEELAKAAEVQELDASTLTAYKALSCVDDTELRRLCWREETLTLAKFRQLVIQRVREAENLQGIKKKNHDFVNYASDKRSGNLPGNCHLCGQSGHWQAECPRQHHQRRGPAGGGRGRGGWPPKQHFGHARVAEEEPESAYLASAARGRSFSKGRGNNYFKRGGGRGKPPARGGRGGQRGHARQAAEAPAQVQQQPATGAGQAAAAENTPEKHESAFIVREEQE